MYQTKFLKRKKIYLYFYFFIFWNDMNYKNRVEYTLEIPEMFKLQFSNNINIKYKIIYFNI